MFVEAVNAGLAAGERSLSKDYARDIISGGLIQFLTDYYNARDMEKCAAHLYCMAKACGALCGKEKDDCLSVLLLCTCLDMTGQSVDLFQAVSDFLCIDRVVLDKLTWQTRENAN